MLETKPRFDLQIPPFHIVRAQTHKLSVLLGVRFAETGKLLSAILHSFHDHLSEQALYQLMSIVT